MASLHVNALLGQLSQWTVGSDGASIQRTFRFSDYYQTIAFVNAVAWLAHQQDHHPHLEVGYGQCTVRYTTHAVHGLSENDFICAAHIDRLHAKN